MAKTEKTEEPKAKGKPSWRDTAAKLLTSRLPSGKAMDAKELKTLADARGTLLTAQLSAARSGHTRRPINRIQDMEYELQTILNGTWRPGISRPSNKEVTAAMRSMSLLGPSPSEKAEADRVDAILLGED